MVFKNDGLDEVLRFAEESHNSPAYLVELEKHHSLSKGFMLVGQSGTPKDKKLIA